MHQNKYLPNKGHLITTEYSPSYKRIRRAFRTVGLLLCVATFGIAVIAQSKTPVTTTPAAASITNPLIKHHRMFYTVMKKWLLESAKRMSEENYNFKPTPEVRGYGEIIGHVANQHYRFCSMVLVEENPNLKLEQTPKTKAEYIAALQGAFTYCDRAYESMNDATAVEMIRHSGMDHPKIGLLMANVAHSSLHYGNLITYMRLKNIVPPSTGSGALEPPK